MAATYNAIVEAARNTNFQDRVKVGLYKAANFHLAQVTPVPANVAFADEVLKQTADVGSVAFNVAADVGAGDEPFVMPDATIATILETVFPRFANIDAV